MVRFRVKWKWVCMCLFYGYHKNKAQGTWPCEKLTLLCVFWQMPAPRLRSFSAVFSLSCFLMSGLCVRVIYWWCFLGIPAIPLLPGKWSVPQRDIFRSCEAAVSVSACTHNPAVCSLKNVVRLKMQSASASVGLSSRLHGCNQREVCVITAAMGTVLNLLSHKVCDWSHQQSSSVFVCASFTQHWVILVLSFMLHRGAGSSAQIAAARDVA